jgi:hypothetical protein
MNQGPGGKFHQRRERRRFYQAELLREVPRLLSALDRCPTSVSGGSFDREYWAWATKDFANQDLQRAVRVLAFLYRHRFPGNRYYRQPALLTWLSQAVRFWLRGQEADGSFDHLYPHEKSWMAAAFTLVDMAAAFSLVGEEVSPELRGSWLAAMRRAGDCLVTRDEAHGFISNHRAGAAAGLLALSRLSGEEVYARRARELMAEVYRRQSPEGWFLEYEGADPGYQTLDTHYQAIYFLESGGDEACLQAVARSLEFLSYFLHPDGSIGGEYGSRSCPHFFPGGFEVFARYLPVAEAMARQGAEGLAQGYSSGLAEAEMRNAVPMATSYVLALEALAEEGDYPGETLPWQREFERLWPQAGLYVRSDADTYTVIGASKGGVIKVFGKRPPRLIFSSCGYAGRLQGGRHLTTQLWTTFPRLDAGGLRPGDEQPLRPAAEIRVEAPFFAYKPDRVMTPVRLLGFRLFNLTVGRWRKLNDFVRKHLIIGRFLTTRQRMPLSLSRCLRFREGRCEVSDRISLEPGAKLEELREYGFFSSVYMASARYFRWQDLAHAWRGEDLAPGSSGEISAGREIRWRGSEEDRGPAA